MARRKPPVIADSLLAGADAETALDTDGLPDQLKKALAEQANVRWTIARPNDAVLEELAAWQARPLEAVHPLVRRVKIRDGLEVVGVGR